MIADKIRFEIMMHFVRNFYRIRLGACTIKLLRSLLIPYCSNLLRFTVSYFQTIYSTILVHEYRNSVHSRARKVHYYTWVEVTTNMYKHTSLGAYLYKQKGCKPSLQILYYGRSDKHASLLQLQS